MFLRGDIDKVPPESFFYPFPDTYGRLHTAEHCLVLRTNERRSLPFLVCTLSLCAGIAFSYASYFSFCSSDGYYFAYVERVLEQGLVV